MLDTKKFEILEGENLIKINKVDEWVSELDCEYIVFEMDDMELKPLSSIKEISEIQLLEFSTQLFLAIEILHKKNIIHYNIKPSNILIDEKNNKLYLADYYVSMFIEPITIVSKAVGMGSNSKYLSPEIWKGYVQSNLTNDVYNIIHKVDLFSAGISLYEAYTKNDIDLVGKKMAFEKIEIEKLIPKTGCEWFDKLISMTVTLTYQERASLVDVLKLFKGVDDGQREKIKSKQKFMNELKKEDEVDQEKEKKNEFRNEIGNFSKHRNKSK